MNRKFDIGDANNVQVEVMPTKHIIVKDGNYLENRTYAVKLSLKDAGIIQSVIGFILHVTEIYSKKWNC